MHTLILKFARKHRVQTHKFLPDLMKAETLVHRKCLNPYIGYTNLCHIKSLSNISEYFANFRNISEYFANFRTWVHVTHSAIKI